MIQKSRICAVCRRSISDSRVDNQSWCNDCNDLYLEDVMKLCRKAIDLDTIVEQANAGWREPAER